MVTALAGVAIALSAAASVGAFIRSAVGKHKRPTIASILVALFGVPFAAASLSGLATGPLEVLGHVPGLSLFAYGVVTAVLVALCAIGGHFLAFVMGAPKGPQAGDVLRGAQLSTADRWNKRTQRLQKDKAVVTLAGLAIDRADEPKHFLLMGTTGTGKSVAIRELLRGAEGRGDRAIIADPDGGFLSRFYDAARGDVILNPFDARSGVWDMMGEVPNDFAAEQLAASLVPSPGGSADASWAARARTLLTAILRRGRAAGINTAEVYRLFAIADRAELRAMLAGTAAEPFLAEGATRLFDSVRSSSGDAMSALEYAASATGGMPFSLTRWASDPGDRRWVFLPYRADQIAALKALIGPWMRLAIFATMSRPESDTAPTWFVADELDAIGKIEGLDDALQRIRKFGGRCVLGFQTIGKVRALYGDGAAAALVENCSTRLILRCAGGDTNSTARFASSLIGQQSYMQQSYSDGAGPGGKTWGNSLSAHTEDAVMPSEIERLPDLSGYLKVPSRPEWFLAKVAWREMPRRTATFVSV
ncbi:type IV secretion system DNA-binding domain-containing protein [Sphingomonas glacialis]|uniref:Type IV secretion system coupling protein TraD DNA-binding domain-containing protein n=1 Tax=Sphingomonas glacialis TaxID=658225 RepID=A0A502FG28_9SPHN|nr:type IV secretion system DNA-binding domain-containing protein [Sphingomonas glacialis]TPG48203.1 hypothetical protein EAH76_20450 [Sphingomonas glacialis]